MWHSLPFKKMIMWNFDSMLFRRFFFLATYHWVTCFVDFFSLKLCNMQRNGTCINYVLASFIQFLKWHLPREQTWACMLGTNFVIKGTYDSSLMALLRDRNIPPPSTLRLSSQFSSQTRTQTFWCCSDILLCYSSLILIQLSWWISLIIVVLELSVLLTGLHGCNLQVCFP